MVTRRFIRITSEEKAAAAAKLAAGSRHKGRNNADGTKKITTEDSKDTQLKQSSKNRRMNHKSDDEGKSEAVTCPKNDNASKKRSRPLEDTGDNDKKRPRKKRQKFINLSDVPEQQPILSNRKDGSSKYQGVSFHKTLKKWQAHIRIDGKYHHIGRYDNEEEAAKDYARAVFKYRGGEAAVERKQQKLQKLMIDLSDAPEKLPILKSNGKSGSSKYQGVYFEKTHKKWYAQIVIDGNSHHIGWYDNEEDAAKDYARAVFKYRGGDSALERLRQQQQQKLMIDLSDVPEQLPILKRNGKGGSSKYQGVTFDKTHKKWQARITIDGKVRSIGNYDNEEDAAKDYARAVYKYRRRKAAVEHQRQKRPKVIDLCDVPEQLPILKSNGKSGSSKYQGVFFNQSKKKWHATIVVEGKLHHIGYYINEEEAAKDYARALHKYRGLKSAVER